MDVIVFTDPALSECSDKDSVLDTNEKSNKQLPGKSKTGIIYVSTKSEYSKIEKVIILLMKVGVITIMVKAYAE